MWEGRERLPFGSPEEGGERKSDDHLLFFSLSSVYCPSPLPPFSVSSPFGLSGQEKISFVMRPAPSVLSCVRFLEQCAVVNEDGIQIVLCHKTPLLQISYILFET
jgi:hypothetical protein